MHEFRGLSAAEMIRVEGGEENLLIIFALASLFGGGGSGGSGGGGFFGKLMWIIELASALGGFSSEDEA